MFLLAMTSSRTRQSSALSNPLSESSNVGSLYPEDDNNHLLQSTNTCGSLWLQYSLIAQEYSAQNKSNSSCCHDSRIRSWLLKLAFLIVVGLGLFICSLEMKFSTYAPKRLSLNGGDQRLLPVSTYFNEDLRVITAKEEDLQSVKLHVFSEMPNVKNETVSYKSGVRFHMSSWTYQYWGLYLLEGTVVKISVCADLHLQFYILRGDKKLKQWTQTILYNNYDYHTSIHPQPSCDHVTKFKSHLLTVTKSDVYYMSFASSVGWRFITQVSVLMDFNRTYFESSKLKYSCMLSNTSCYAKLQYGSNEITMLEAIQTTNASSSCFHVIAFRYEMSSRWPFYLRLFGNIYLVAVVATVLYTIWRLCVRCRSGTAEEKEALVTPVRRYAHSLKSPLGGEGADGRAWVVVTPLSSASSEQLYEVAERDDVSILRSFEEEQERRASLSNISRDSLFLRNRNDSTLDDMYRTAQYQNEQQLLDSCMTSAGVSAI